MDNEKDQERAKTACSTKKRLTKEDVEELKERLDLEQNIQGIEHKILVMSGKGGVGKSSIAANIAVGLSMRGKHVGLMDIDVHGPSIPTIVGLEGVTLKQTADGLLPVEYSSHLKVISIGFLLRNRKDAVIWRAPMKHGLIKQFLADVVWGELDYLVVDCPPGTGDELISITQLLEGADGAVIVTTPQDVALNDVRKSVTFCREVNLPVIGVVENMSGFACPSCGTTVDIFKSGGGERLAAEMAVPFLGRIPIDPCMVEHSDSGKPLVQHAAGSVTAEAFAPVLNTILAAEQKISKENVMPIYEYLCDNCGGRFEMSQSMNDAPVSVCPQCEGSVRRVISGGSGFIVKGGGSETSVSTQCGKTQTCCGSNTPCETPSCG